MRRTRVALLGRLERLESHAAAVAPTIKLCFGHLRRLPRDYQGEKHVVVTKQLPNKNGQEWVEFEEVPGPDPNPPKRNHTIPDRLDIVYVKPHPHEGEVS